MGILDFFKSKGNEGSGTISMITEDIFVTTPTIPTMPKYEGAETIKEGGYNAMPIPKSIDAKAQMAQQLKDNPLLNAILDELKEFNLNLLLKTKEGEVGTREDLYRKIKTIEDIRGKINRYIANAESEKKRIESEKGNYGVV